MRQLVEKHTQRPALRHVATSRIDPFGFALEGYDAIGRRRDRDLGDRPIDTAARLRDGTEFDGLDGLRHYLLTTRRDAVAPAVLPQAAGLRTRPRRPAFRRAACSTRWSKRSRRTTIASAAVLETVVAQPPVPRDPRARTPAVHESRDRRRTSVV